MKKYAQTAAIALTGVAAYAIVDSAIKGIKKEDTTLAKNIHDFCKAGLQAFAKNL